MTVNAKSIYYITNPESKILVCETNIKKLENKYFDFNRVCNNGSYIFTFKNLNIIISRGGQIQLSLMSTLDVSEAISLLERMASKINSVLEIEIYSRKVMI